MRLFKIASLACLVALAACSSKNNRQPAELSESILQTAVVDQIWSLQLEGESSFQTLAPVLSEQSLLVTSATGDFKSLNPQTGVIEFALQLEPLSSPVTATSQGLVYVDKNGFLKHRDRQRQLLWSYPLNALVLDKILYTQQQIIVQSIDGRISSFDEDSGKLQWVNQIVQPELTIKGNTQPVLVGNSVITAFANGRVSSIDVITGVVNWEYTVSSNQYGNALERILDVDADLVVIDNLLLVVGHFGKMTLLDVRAGKPVWQSEYNSLKAAAVDSDKQIMYIVDLDGSLIAYDTRTDKQLWKDAYLRYRQPTAMVLINDKLVLSDYEGYIHVVDPRDGTPMARLQVADSAITNSPMVLGKYLIIQTQNARVSALEIF
jgi:outer membrane protein assembly factor BamB